MKPGGPWPTARNQRRSPSLNATLRLENFCSRSAPPVAVNTEASTNAEASVLHRLREIFMAFMRLPFPRRTVFHSSFIIQNSSFLQVRFVPREDPPQEINLVSPLLEAVGFARIRHHLRLDP